MIEGDRGRRIGILRALWLIVGLGWTRLCNRTVASLAGAFGGRKRRTKAGDGVVRRAGLPRRNRVGLAVGLILSCLVIFGITIQASMFLSRIYRAVEERDGTAKVEVPAGSWLYGRLSVIEEGLRGLAVEESMAGSDAKVLMEVQKKRSDAVNEVRQLLITEASTRPEGSRFDPHRATRRFLAGGAKALRGSEAQLEYTNPLPRKRAVFFGERRGEVLVVLGAALTLLVASALTMSLGVSNQDLGRVGWATEWLFGFPVPTTSLFMAKIGEYAAFNFFGWIAFPLLTLVFVAAGFGWWSGLPGFGFTLYLNALVGSARVLVETGLRRWLGLAGRKNAQAFFALVGSVLFFGFYAVMASPELAAWFVRVAAGMGRELAWWNPISLPLLACDGGATAVVVGLICLGVAGAVVFGVATICSRMVTGGLIGETGNRAGRRVAKVAGRRCFGPRGALGKEFLLLVRDRSVMVQVLVTPVLVLGFWLSLNIEVASGILTGFRHAATAGFVTAVYVLSFACLPSMKREGGGVGMLFCFPRSPSSILFRKALFWGMVGCLYAVPILGWGYWKLGGEVAASDIAVGAMVLVGVFLYAFIATAMGALATDPLAPRTNVPVDAKTAYLFMMLVALFTYGIYAPSAWTRLVQLVLCSLLGYALWQRMRDALPYYFEPVDAAPRRISLSHGLVATYSFFVLQGVGSLVVFSKVPGLSPGAALLVSYVAAGLIVFVASVLVLWRTEGEESVFRFPQVVSLGGSRGILHYAAWVLGAAVVAIVVGLFYLQLSETVPGLKALKKASMPAEEFGKLGENFRWWFAAMAVVAAPLCEEFIFRGLVYRGLRRTVGMSMSVLGSAALFALVHPPFSVFPVYVLGVVTALAFESTGRLIAPVMIHMAYNAAMIATQLGLW